jgi:hypothetical protein
MEGVNAPEGHATLSKRQWPRLRLDKSRVDEFKQLYADGGPAALPPVEVVLLADGSHLVADGFHRVEALHSLGITDIPTVTLTPPPGADPELFTYVRALETAATSAKPLTLSEKRAAADRLIAETPEASDSEIGRLTGLSHQTVGRRRQRQLSNGQPEPVQADEADRYLATVSAQDIASKLVRSVDRLWESRGLTDTLVGEKRMGKHLAQAMVDYFGDDAQQWANRFALWACAAADAFEKQT